MTHPALIERITRSLAYMLRHQPEKFDLEVDAQGYAHVDDVVRALNERLGEPVDLADLEAAITSGDRPRYEIRGDQVRALYGHSIPVEPGEPSRPPEFLYVGIDARDAERALRYGLRGGRRRFLHLALTPEDAREAGRRSAPEYSVLNVFALDAWEEGINFYDRQALFLAEEVPTQFLELAQTFHDGYELAGRPSAPLGGGRGRDERRGPPRERGFSDRPARMERPQRGERHAPPMEPARMEPTGRGPSDPGDDEPQAGEELPGAPLAEGGERPFEGEGDGLRRRRRRRGRGRGRGDGAREPRTEGEEAPAFDSDSEAPGFAGVEAPPARAERWGGGPAEEQQHERDPRSFVERGAFQHTERPAERDFGRHERPERAGPPPERGRGERGGGHGGPRDERGGPRGERGPREDRGAMRDERAVREERAPREAAPPREERGSERGFRDERGSRGPREDRGFRERRDGRRDERGGERREPRREQPERPSHERPEPVRPPAPAGGQGGFGLGVFEEEQRRPERPPAPKPPPPPVRREPEPKRADDDLPGFGAGI